MIWGFDFLQKGRFMKNAVHAAFAVLMVPAIACFAQTPQAPKPPVALKPLPVVSSEGTAQLESLIGTALHAKPVKARKILVFSRCEGYVHGEGIVYGNKALEIAAKTGAFQADFTTDYAALTDKANLFRYDAVVLNNTTHLKAKENPALVPNLIAFVKGGRGLCVIHAGADNFYDSPDAADMVGGQFDGHPWGGGGTWAFKLDEPSHPLNRSFEGKNFKAGDEIYQQKSPFYDRAKVRVLVSLDLSDEKTAAVKNQKRADKDFAVSWVRPYGEGRVFYTSFAHDRRAYLNKAILWHILDGLQYTLGDITADDKPVSK